MTEPLNDNQLKAEFRHLRETETQAAPDYRQSLAGPPGRCHAGGFDQRCSSPWLPQCWLWRSPYF